MRLILVALLLAGAGYLYMHRRHASAPQPPPPAPLDLPATPVLSLEDIAKVRRSTNDSDPQVRWAAVQLLVTLKDPELVAVLDKFVQHDQDPELRRKAVELLEHSENVALLPPLIRGLKDTEKAVRMASLRSLGEIGDPSAIPWITASLKDYEPDVKVEALRALGRFEERRKIEFQAIAADLRRDYEEAVKGSKKSPFFSLAPTSGRK